MCVILSAIVSKNEREWEREKLCVRKTDSKGEKGRKIQTDRQMSE